jgi:hypothetical protein
MSTADADTDTDLRRVAELIAPFRARHHPPAPGVAIVVGDDKVAAYRDTRGRWCLFAEGHAAERLAGEHGPQLGGTRAPSPCGVVYAMPDGASARRALRAVRDGTARTRTTTESEAAA